MNYDIHKFKYSWLNVPNSILFFSQGTCAAICNHLQWYTAGASEEEMVLYCELKQNSISRRSNCMLCNSGRLQVFRIAFVFYCYINLKFDYKENLYWIFSLV